MGWRGRSPPALGACLLPAHLPGTLTAYTQLAHCPSPLLTPTLSPFRPPPPAVMDLERVGVPLLVLTAAAALTRRWWLPRAQAWRRRRRLKQHSGRDRDLNV